MPVRRDVLKGSAALAAAGLAGMAPASARPGGPLRFIIDARLPEAARLAERARAGGHRLADPGGEIVSLLLARHADWLTGAGPIVGLTGYVDFALARDVLRSASRPIRHALALDGTAAAPGTTPAERALAALLGPSPRPAGARSTSFLWLA